MNYKDKFTLAALAALTQIGQLTPSSKWSHKKRSVRNHQRVLTMTVGFCGFDSKLEHLRETNMAIRQLHKVSESQRPNPTIKSQVTYSDSNIS